MRRLGLLFCIENIAPVTGHPLPTFLRCLDC